MGQVPVMRGCFVPDRSGIECACLSKMRHHMRIRARDRLNVLLDPEGRYDVGHTAVPYDSLKFRDSKKYPDRLKAAEKATGKRMP